MSSQCADYANACMKAGLSFVRKSEYHWQIKGGTRRLVVNCWPHSKRGFVYQVGVAPAKRGTIHDAIKLAGIAPQAVAKLYTSTPAPNNISDTPPWAEYTRPHIGIIRRFWRWLWVLAILIQPGCNAISKETIKIQVTDPVTHAKPDNAVVTASYEVELK
jgi:hypothetical protein